MPISVNGRLSDFHSEDRSSTLRVGTDAVWSRQHAQALAKFQALNKLCAGCSRSLTYEQRCARFCTKSCSATFYNNQRTSVILCLRCHKSRSIPGARVGCKNRYCKSCAKIRANPTINELRTDLSRKKFLIAKHGHACWTCKETTWNELLIPIELDHIDGDSDNNAEENLRLLCPNCHAQTPTYKSKNKRGSSRRKRHKLLVKDHSQAF